MQTSEVDLSIDGSLATISLNRPHSHNGIDLRLALGLVSAVEEVHGQPQLGCLLIRGAGPAFSVGGDLRELASYSSPDLPAAMRQLVDTYNRAVRGLSDLHIPVVTAVHGSVAGGALGLVCAADIAIAASDTVFNLAYPALGLSADGGASWFLPRLVGLRKAQELFLLSPQFSATDAREWGLVTRTCARRDLDAVSLDIATTLAGRPSVSTGSVRLLLRDAPGRTLEEHLEHETQSMWQCASHPRFHEQVQAFVTSRSTTRPPAEEPRGRGQ